MRSANNIQQPEALPLKPEPEGLQVKPKGLSSGAQRAECVPMRFTKKIMISVDSSYKKLFQNTPHKLESDQK